MPFKWGILGTGAISAKFAAGLTSARDAEVAFIASRSLERAQAFAAGAGIPRAFGDYAQAAAEGGADAIYIATPPSEHVANALICINAGIPVLIEKPLATNAAEASKLAEAARAKSVFVMEALWTRFLPATQALKKQVASGAVGTPRIVSGNFGTSQQPDPGNSMFNPSLGGGALAHLGCYPLSVAQWLFGVPESVQATGIIGPTGVDEYVAIQTQYRDSVIGSFFVSLRSWAPDDFQVLGSEGMIRFRGSVVRPYGLDLTRETPRLPERAGFGLKARLLQHPVVHHVAQRLGRSSRGVGNTLNHWYSGNGYHYQADEVQRCVREGLLQSPVMPMEESIAVLETSDRIRAIISQAKKK